MDIVLDHRDVSAESISGNSVSSNFLIDCNLPVNAVLNVQVSTDNYIALGNSGIKSAIAINGTPVIYGQGVPVRLATGENRLTMTSTLKGPTTVTAGSYMGTAMMIISLQ